MRGRLAALGRWLARRAGWIALALAAAVLLLGCVLVFPRLLYPPISQRQLDQAKVTGKDGIQLQSERLKLQNDARTTLLQGLGGAVLLLGAWFTYRQLVTGREQLRVAEQGQITERFTRAVDQLGSDRLDVRLGGIYALERIARDSEDDRRTIAEVLTAYLRQRSPWPPSQPGQYRADWPLDQQPDLRTRASEDVQVALTVLGRGPFSKPRGILERLDLRRIDLRKAYLYGAHLEGAVLVEAHLEGADLRGAHMEGALLTYAHLKGAQLHGARLERADLRRARLQRAVLVDAHLEGADLSGAYLEGADLIEAHLEGVDLSDAHLERAMAHETTRWPDGFDPQAAGVVVVVLVNESGEPIPQVDRDTTTGSTGTRVVRRRVERPATKDR